MLSGAVVGMAPCPRHEMSWCAEHSSLRQRHAYRRCHRTFVIIYVAFDFDGLRRTHFEAEATRASYLSVCKRIGIGGICFMFACS